MKDYKRLTHDWFGCRACVDGECIIPETFCQHRGLCEKHNELVKIENEIESGQLCAREEVRKETAREIFNELFLIIVNADFLKFFEKAQEYGVELLGNSEKLEDE